MRVLVMGGTRFNGLHLVQELVKHGHEVTTFNRGITQAVLPPGVRRLHGDRTDHEAMREVFADEEFDCIQDMSAYTTDDVRSMDEIFHGRTGHYIFASSTAIYAHAKILPIRETHPVDLSEKQIEYGRNKIACEQYLTRAYWDHGFPASMVPFASVFGPHNMIRDREQRMFVRLLQGRPALVPGDGTTLGQIGHVDDEAKALRMMMLNPNTFGKRYNLTGKDYFTDEGYIDTIADVVGVTPEKISVPASLMDDLWADKLPLGGGPLVDRRGAGGGAWLTRVSQLVQRSAPNIHPWNQNVIFSIDRLMKEINWEPEYNFRSAVEQTFEWFMSEGLDKTLAEELDFSLEDLLLERIRDGG